MIYSEFIWWSFDMIFFSFSPLLPPFLSFFFLCCPFAFQELLPIYVSALPITAFEYLWLYISPLKQKQQIFWLESGRTSHGSSELYRNQSSSLSSWITQICLWLGCRTVSMVPCVAEMEFFILNPRHQGIFPS